MQSSHVHDVNKYNVHVSKAMILKRQVQIEILYDSVCKQEESITF